MCIRDRFRIEPNAFYIEEEIKGVGCVHPKSVTSTPFGLFWCDSKNMYWHNGSAINTIGDTVKQGGPYSWKPFAKFDDLGETGTCSNGTYTNEETCVAAGATWTSNNEVDVDTLTAPQPPIVVYDANKQSVHFIFKFLSVADGSNNKNGSCFSWMYNIPMGKWDLMEIKDGTSGGGTNSLGKVLNAFTNTDGNAWYVINASDSGATPYLYAMNQGSSKRAYSWESKEITIQNDTLYKSFIAIDILGVTADLSSYLTLEIDGTAVDKSFEAHESGGRYSIKYGSRKGKYLKIKLTEVPGTNIIDSIGIIFRMRGAK